MSIEQSESKSTRILSIFSRLSEGKVLKKAELADEFHVNERSIQRDLDALRAFMDKEHLDRSVEYDSTEKGYRLINTNQDGLNNDEILAVCKILLESRSMRREEMMPILDKLIECAVPEKSKRAVKRLIANEAFHYIEPHHGKMLLHGLWEIGQAIQEQRVMEIEYERMKEPNIVKRRVLPVGLMFSEYYFYLTALLEDKQRFENPDDLFPTIYRIDRIRRHKILNEHFRVPYRDRFEEGEFRKRVQFMYGGKLQHIRFRYTGPSIEAVLDRLPTAEIVSQETDGWIVEAEVFGKGIDMWLRSQGESVRIIRIKRTANEQESASDE